MPKRKTTTLSLAIVCSQGKLNADFEGMGFDFVTLSMHQGGHLNISEQYLTIVKHIDSTVNQYK
jgi:hypothetical protein